MTKVTLSVLLITVMMSFVSGKKDSDWSENWTAWSGKCNCGCKKASKTIAIIIPKYKFVDIPTAMEIPSKKLGGMNKVKVDHHKGGKYDDDEDDHHSGGKYDDDEDDYHEGGKYDDEDDHGYDFKRQDTSAGMLPVDMASIDRHMFFVN
ncbi:hypothetical protein HDE_05407 [Halotydeus destructor]|nr:hypothetical protein HDE_05407 [Halotydeus destructor]